MKGWAMMVTSKFQSTPPARGATSTLWQKEILTHTFQSTPPARGATSCGSFLKPKTSISIHAPREGGDYAAMTIDVLAN